jgi:hypothetical protein
LRVSRVENFRLPVLFFLDLELLADQVVENTVETYRRMVQEVSKYRNGIEVVHFQLRKKRPRKVMLGICGHQKKLLQNKGTRLKTLVEAGRPCLGYQF